MSGIYFVSYEECNITSGGHVRCAAAPYSTRWHVSVPALGVNACLSGVVCGKCEAPEASWMRVRSQLIKSRPFCSLRTERWDGQTQKNENRMEERKLIFSDVSDNWTNLWLYEYYNQCHFINNCMIALDEIYTVIDPDRRPTLTLTHHKLKKHLSWFMYTVFYC